jgi:hypothetical protein
LFTPLVGLYGRDQGTSVVLGSPSRKAGLRRSTPPTRIGFDFTGQYIFRAQCL